MTGLPRPCKQLMRSHLLVLVIFSFVLHLKAATSIGSTTIIAHRGSPCIFPEETLEGYQHAIDNGADYIEMDVVSTKDGALLCRHDLTLDNSTDIAEHPEFADRRWNTTLSDGRMESGFFALNFTLAELKTLYAKQAIPGRDQSSARKYRLRSLPEVLDLAMQSEQNGRRIGVYIETKDPTFHDSVGLPLEERVIHTLMKARYKETLDAPVILQSFEEPSLKRLSALMKAQDMDRRAGLIWLLDCFANVSDAELDDFASYGQGIGPEKSLIAPLVSAPECGRPENAACYTYTPDQRCTGQLASGGAVLGQSSNSTTAAVPPESSLVQRAHQRNLLVHGYTFRNEERFMAVNFAADPLAELTYYRRLGVDGVFVDCPSTAREWKVATGQLSAQPFSWVGTVISGPGPRASAAIASFSVLVTLTAVAVAWGISACLRRRRRYRAKYDLFPSDMFNTRDLNWYPPSDYRTAVVGNEAAHGEEEEELPTSTAIMMTAIDSSPRAGEHEHTGPAGHPMNGQ